MGTDIRAAGKEEGKRDMADLHGANGSFFDADGRAKADQVHLDGLHLLFLLVAVARVASADSHHHPPRICL